MKCTIFCMLHGAHSFDKRKDLDFSAPPLFKIDQNNTTYKIIKLRVLWNL